MPKFLIALLLLCSVAFGDEYDARVRTLCAKVVFESKDQAVIPDTPPNVRLSIARGIDAAWRSFLATPPSVPVVNEAENELFSFAVKIRGFKESTVNGKRQIDGFKNSSGVIVPQGVLTAYHCVTGCNRVVVESSDGEAVPATVLKFDQTNDLALLSVKWATSRSPAKLSNTIPPHRALMRSCARDRNGLLRCEEHRFMEIRENRILCENSFISGMSGGGLFHSDNTLCGIIVETNMETEPYVGQSVSFDRIAAFLGQPAGRVPRLLFFHASWCGPCQAQLTGKDAFPEWLREKGWLVGESDGSHIQLIDTDKNAEITSRYGVEQIPALVLIDRVDGVVKAYPPVASKGRTTIIELLGKIK